MTTRPKTRRADAAGASRSRSAGPSHQRAGAIATVVLMFTACTSHVPATHVFSDPTSAQFADAVATGDTAQIRTLIESGANRDAVGDQGVNLLQWAMLRENKRGFEALLVAGADATHVDESGDTVMHYAAMASDPAYLDMLLAHRVEPNSRNAVNGKTPLMSSLVAGREVQFHQLLAAGADPNLADDTGNTALHVAAQVNNFAAVLSLLRAGGDPAARNKQDRTFQPYFFMTQVGVLSDEGRRGRQSVIAWLREHDVQVEDSPPGPR